MHLVWISYSLCQGFSAITTPNMVAVEIGFQNSLIKIKCSGPNQINTKCMNDTGACMQPHTSLFIKRNSFLFGEHSILTGLA